MDDVIVYPLRGVRYFTYINKRTGEIKKITPLITEKEELDLMEKMGLMGEVIPEEIWSLSTFLEGVVNEYGRKY